MSSHVAHSVRSAASAVVAIALALAASVSAQTTIPALSPTLEEDFERNTLEDWNVSGGGVSLAGGTGPDGSIAMAVSVSAGESHLVRGAASPVARADEAYFSFWFHPNGVTYTDPGFGFVPDRSILIASIKAPTSFRHLVGLNIQRLGGQYTGYLQWRDGSNNEQFDFAAGSFNLINGWQRVTIGYRVDEWVAAWVDGTLVRSVTGVSHLESRGTIAEVGKGRANSTITPSGTMRFDDLNIDIPKIPDLWVDAATGDDTADGKTPGTALETIDRASELAGAGTTVHIMPGIYRGPVTPAQGGTAAEPAIYRAEQGRGTAILRGSETSASLSWTQLTTNSIGLPAGTAPTNIWWTDLSSWNLAEAPRFVARMDGSGDVAERLPLAREPDWTVTTSYKPTEFWWEATGGIEDVGCDPSVDFNLDVGCDEVAGNQSETMLTDSADDTMPAGVEAGNLTTLGDLTGATIFSLDTNRGHYHYNRTIIAHDVAAGTVTVNAPCLREGKPGLGWSSKYYVEGKPILLDNPGEWWFDTATNRLYLWPPSPGNPAAQDLEISRWDAGFNLRDRSWITVDSMVVELWNTNAVDIGNTIAQKSIGVRIIGSLLQWANRSISIQQQMESGRHEDKRIEGLEIANNELAYADTQAFKMTYFWEGGADPDLWTRTGIFDTVIRDNLMRDSTYRSEPLEDSTGMFVVRFPTQLQVLRNTFQDAGTEGALIGQGINRSSLEWGVPSSLLAAGEVLMKDNLFLRNCTMKNDCGGMRIWGRRPDYHIFRDFLLMDNVFADNIGWGWSNERRSINIGGIIPGAGAAGLYFDQTSGVHTYRNIIYSNGLSGVFLTTTWRDGLHSFVGNTIANNVFGMRFGSFGDGTHDSVDLRVLNNIFVNNLGYAISLGDDDGMFSNITIDYNLYYLNGWGTTVNNPGVFNMLLPTGQTQWQTVADLQMNTDFEPNGQQGDPSFVDYDPDDRDSLDGSFPDFRLRNGSIAIDAGTISLPASLDSLQGLLGVTDPSRIGPRWDQGAFEGGVTVPGDPIFSDGFESGSTSAWSQSIGE